MYKCPEAFSTQIFKKVLHEKLKNFFSLWRSNIVKDSMCWSSVPKCLSFHFFLKNVSCTKVVAQKQVLVFVLLVKLPVGVRKFSASPLGSRRWAGWRVVCSTLRVGSLQCSTRGISRGGAPGGAVQVSQYPLASLNGDQSEDFKSLHVQSPAATDVLWEHCTPGVSPGLCSCSGEANPSIPPPTEDSLLASWAQSPNLHLLPPTLYNSLPTSSCELKG